MNVVIYCRVSSKEQIAGTSLESQERACRDYANAKGMRVLKVFIEQGESAKFADRTQLLQLIEFCRQSQDKIETLLVWKIDRFARNVADHYSIKTALLKYGVRVVSVTEPIDSDPTGKLMEGVLASVAQFDNDVRAARTVQGMRSRIKEGIFPWGPPLGYMRSVTTGEKKTLPDVPNQPIFDLLQRAWKLFASGAYTQAEMGRLMGSWGLTTARGGSFGPQSLYQLFTNPYYKGILVDPWDGAEYEGKHVPLVTVEEFARAQEAIAKRNRSLSHQKDNPEFPLRGLARCDACLHPLTGAFSRGRSRRYPYYVCQAKPCSKRGKSHAAGHVHEEFEDFLNTVTPQPDLLDRIGDLIVREVQDHQADRATRMANRKARAAQLDRELQGLIRMRAQSLITDEEFLLQKKTLTSQRTALETSVSQNAIDVAEVREKFKEITTPLVQLRETWQTIQPAFRRRFERLILPAGFEIGKTRTAELGGLFSFFRDFAHPDSSVVPRALSDSNRVLEDIRGFWNVFTLVEEEKRIPRSWFRCSHRKRPSI
ncbi:MAG TPA: recombinase family protein [Candidatus Dormibacteraeota bacterium]|nr:recombinase family protein [Candidatus Dormibacteraeota bacterium]